MLHEMNQTVFDKILNELAAELKPAVAKLEASMPTTKNHYGSYMTILNKIAERNEAIAKVGAVALVRAGANPAGVIAAVQALGWI